MGFLSRVLNLKNQETLENVTGHTPPGLETYLPPPGPPPNHLPLTNTDKFTFLQRLTSSHRHSGKTFYQHLFNVYSALLSLNLPQPVCDAGLFHSIYGTEFYAFQNKEVTRGVVKGIIGDYSESLVYVFCTARPRFDSIVKGEAGGDALGRDMQRDLCWIEIANLGDQNAGGRYNGKLKVLRETIERLEKEGSVDAGRYGNVSTT